MEGRRYRMRLIDADNIKYVFDLTIEKPIYSGKDIQRAISSMKTMEPQKVSRWNFFERREPQYDLLGVKTWAVAYKCSGCGFIHTVIEDFGHYAYCPRCGSKMEGSEADGID